LDTHAEAKEKKKPKLTFNPSLLPFRTTSR